jgi:hypothetical protein
MANVNNPHGFRPLLRSISGGPGAACLQVSKLAGYATALFIGDAVTKVSGSTQNWPAVSAAITPGTTAVMGVNIVYGAASTATNHLIIPVDSQIFEVQANGTVNITAAMLNQNANINLGAGSATLQISGHVLDSNTMATTNTLDLHVMQLWQSVDNAVGQYARLEVKFNSNVYGNQQAGA